MKPWQLIRRFRALGAPPVAAAYWSPIHRSPDVDLTSSNAIATNPDSGGWSVVRGVTGRNTGKGYAEILRISGAEPPIVGLMRADFNGSSGGGTGMTGVYVGQETKSWGIQTNYSTLNSRALHNGSVVGSAVTGIVNGEFARVCYDAPSGKIWVGNEVAWVGGGDPAAGTSPTFTTTASTVLYLGAALFFASSTAASVRVRTAAADMAGSIPSGFDPWG